MRIYAICILLTLKCHFEIWAIRQKIMLHECDCDRSEPYTLNMEKIISDFIIATRAANIWTITHLLNVVYVCLYDVAYFALLCCAQCNRILLYIYAAYIHKRNLEKLFEISLNSEIKLFLFLLKQRVCMNVSPKKIKSKFNSGAACYEIVINYTHTKKINEAR